MATFFVFNRIYSVKHLLSNQSQVHKVLHKEISGPAKTNRLHLRLIHLRERKINDFTLFQETWSSRQGVEVNITVNWNKVISNL